jgi:meso-butanediol dehydrogenase/(S,S)-butanediol dehydrogenase/diacetyl reductase
MRNRFTGKVAVVTGGASGIGEAIGARLCAEGAAVLFADRNMESGRAVVGRLAAHDVAFLQLDVTSAVECEGMVREAVGRWGGLDILVNSAGVGALAPVAALTETEWDAVLDTNLKGTFLCCRAAFSAMVDRGGGVILNLASAAGLRALEGMAAYAASKAGVVHFSRVLALEGAAHQIRVHALCPTWIDTPMVRNHLNRFGDAEARRRDMAASIPLGRLGTVDDVAASALFLASDEAAFLTGIALPVDGGSVLR